MFKAFRFRDALFATLSLIGLITVFQYISYLIVPVLGILSAWWGRLLLTVAALFAACVLFYIREVYRFRYALMELMFGLVSTWYSISALTTEPKQWPVVIGAMYLVVRGLDNLKTGHLQRMVEWRQKGMNGTPEAREEFLKAVFHGVRFNGRFAIVAAPRLGKTQREMYDTLSASMPSLAAKQAKETGYDAEQIELYVEAHRKAYESLAEEFGLNAPSS
ncbi:hypothetical protein SAMN05444166_3946 [Singulisphaera sp. GP187]|uniref:hypothetical protein n=1 Tax=Singulisphaera sp. GP187 TaxID=1882752 RepID=UPI00092C5DBB|nr:hypothetical protein [Singulisphaera sp. GP187]SIO34396.1 hypothetical protein SAMN05444166_3946 [Singulisphaera sp. GP187]